MAATLELSERARVADFIPRDLHILMIQFRLDSLDGINERGKGNEHAQIDRIKLNTRR